MNRPLLERLTRLRRHLWWDESDTQRQMPPAATQRLTQRVAASERLHSGQMRLCIVAALPAGDVWRAHRASAVRQRAIAMFSQLRVWDTEHNNGVLIYLLLAEQAIEIVADRALARRVSPAQWHDIISRMAPALAAKRFEDGLNQALADTTALLAQHFGNSGEAPTANNTLPARINELPDAPFQQ